MKLALLELIEALKNKMNIALLSDTHTLHKKWYNSLGVITQEKFDNADLLIFTGDYSDSGSYRDTESFLSWFNSRPNRYKVMIAGIHEGYGKLMVDETLYINCSSLDGNYKPVNPPIFVTVSETT